MARITLDFSETPDDSAMPEGEYNATIDKVVGRQGKESQHMYLNWSFIISEGDYAGRKVYMMTSLAPKALWNVKDNFTVCGVKITRETPLVIELDDDDVLETPALAGMPVRIQIIQEEYNQRTQNKVNAILEAYGLEDDDVEADENSLELL